MRFLSTNPAGNTVDYLVVAGGGAGGDFKMLYSRWWWWSWSME